MTLSYRARGLLAHLRENYQPGDVIDTAALAMPEHREGRDAIRGMLRELAGGGHVQERRTQNQRGHWRTETLLVTPGTEKPIPVNTDKANPQVQPETGKPAPVQPKPEKPSPVADTFPQVTPETDSPAPEKPGPSTCTPVGSTSVSTSVVNKPTTSASRPSRAHTRERVTPAELNRTAVKPTAFQLVAFWAETQPKGTVLAPQQRELAKHVDTLLAQGATLDVLRPALDLWAVEGRSPAYLPHAYAEAARAARSGGNPGHSTRDVRGSRVRQPASRPSTTDQRVRDALALKERLRAAGAFDNDPDPAEHRPHLRALPGAAS